jgi:NDP-sugar pyrophosphorylase family protein
MNRRNILLVPSATLVPEEMRLDLGPIPMCMIPLEGRPSLDHISEKYEELETENYVATMQRRAELENYLSTSGQHWSETVVDSSSLADTVLQSLEEIGDLEESYLYINFADTLVEPLRESEDDLVYFDEVEYTGRWTSFTEKDGKINSITEKFSKFSSGPKKVFTGVFGISDPEKFKQKLSEALESESALAPFFQALKNYLNGGGYELVRVENWTDVGHIDTYNEAKKDFLNTREFNHLKVDKKKNTITKKSPDVEKLRPEIEWYDKIPADLKPYTPRIYRSAITEEGAEIEMDYTGYPSLGEILLYGSHGIHIWRSIYSNLFEMVQEFQSYSKKLSEEEIKENLREMYLRKTERRLNKVRDSSEFSVYFENEEVEINGRKLKSTGYILDNLEKILEDSGLYDAEEFTIIHGDPTFSNLLYEAGSGVINLIDPRGEFGDFQIYGDTCYDLAKMRHSVSGKYDFIINDMFDVEVDGDSIQYQVFTDEKHEDREELFNRMLSREYGKDIDRIKGIEALLFLSMVPLHSDNPERQHYMISKGIELANKNLVI